jgi:hypothetical protein
MIVTQRISGRPDDAMDLDGDLADDEWLGAVGEELVEEGEERAGDDADGPHAERPHRQRRVVGRRHGQPDLLHQRHVAVVLLAHSRDPAAGVPLDLHRRRRLARLQGPDAGWRTLQFRSAGV